MSGSFLPGVGRIPDTLRGRESGSARALPLVPHPTTGSSHRAQPQLQIHTSRLLRHFVSRDLSSSNLIELTNYIAHPISFKLSWRVEVYRNNKVVSTRICLKAALRNVNRNSAATGDRSSITEHGCIRNGLDWLSLSRR